MSLQESDMLIEYERGQHEVGECIGLREGCVYCISEGIRDLLRSGITIEAIQAKIIECNDDSGSAIAEMMEGLQ